MEKIIIGAICAIVIAIICTGCSGSTGWQFGIGVYPVTSIDHAQTLKPETQKKDVKY